MPALQAFSGLSLTVSTGFAACAVTCRTFGPVIGLLLIIGTSPYCPNAECKSRKSGCDSVLAPWTKVCVQSRPDSK